MHGGGTPQSTSQVLSVPAYIRKKALNPGGKFECTHAQMMGKSPNIQIWIWFSMECRIYVLKAGWNIWDFALIFAVCRKWGGKDKELKWLEMASNFFEMGVVKYMQNSVGIIFAN